MASQSLLQQKSIRIQLAVITIAVLLSALAGAYMIAEGILPDQYDFSLGQTPNEYDLPDGFEITVFTNSLAAPRFMVAHPEQDVLFVTERGGERILALSDTNDDRIAETEVVVDNLSAPSGIDFHDGWLYIAQDDRITRVQLTENLTIVDREDIVTGLPTERNTNEVDSNQRALLVHNDEVYVTVGASCAACEETDSLRATVMVYNLDGSNERVFARGVYTALGLAVNPLTDEIWITVQGRPLLEGDAPEAIYTLENSDDLGWPRCHAGTMPDPEFGSEVDCEQAKQPLLQLVPQSNVTNLIFYTPDDTEHPFYGDALVVLHGGVNESERQVGMGVLSIDIDPETGELLSTEELPFMNGFWLSEEPGDFVGRPYGITQAPDGTIFISDDSVGAIYEIRG